VAKFQTVLEIRVNLMIFGEEGGEVHIFDKENKKFERILPV
jgi:hypothetical protein